MSDLRLPEINHVMLAGRLTADPELRRINGDRAVCDLRVASTRRYKVNGEQKEDTLFFDATVWGQAAEYCAAHLSKGRPVAIEGSLKSEQWEDKTTGQKRSKLKVNATRVQPLDWVNDASTGAVRNTGTTGAAAAIPEDDIPF